MSGPYVIQPTPESRAGFAAYAYAWRQFVRELRNLKIEFRDEVDWDKIQELLDKYQIQEFEADGIKRIGIEFPDLEHRHEFEEYYFGRKVTGTCDCNKEPGQEHSPLCSERPPK